MNPEGDSTNLTSSSSKESIILETLDGFEFEKLCGRIFEKLKYGHIEDVQDTGDTGRDILIHAKKGLIVAECKHHPHSSIGRPVVQKLHSAVISSGAIKGILITTGKFSVQAIEHAKTLTPPIELVDRNILIDLATQAGIELILEGKRHSVFAYSISDIDSVQNRLDGFSSNRFESYPENASKLLRIKNRLIKMVPSYVIQYDVNATFETSVGVIHKENVEDGTLLTDGNEGKMLKEEIARHLASAPLVVYNDSNFKDLDIKKDSFHIDSNTLKTLSKNFISKKHSRKVVYYGGNNVRYEKLCEPSEREIFISDIKQTYIPFQQIGLQTLEKNYDMVAIENPSHLLCYTKMLNCAICGGYIKDNKVILCNSCGAVVHNNRTLDSHSFKCQICGKTLCRKCTYDLWFRKKVCKDCGLKSGKDIKPLSMEMNQHTMLGMLFIIVGIIGLIIGETVKLGGLNYSPLLGAASIVIGIIGIGIILSNPKSEEAPPYEVI